ncbi:MAG: nickel-dependent hydrogenase large subunit [Candidatus Freyarchaeota archaeon]|nr:nickel-dependent hydrogenase large subunit [Candidatus Jordarchaeia archaeon]MBS7267850.1 nickel-dependent hydrogenase large subunit [Candidatus Jordarchaeia archaeon]MBS7280943.1 nickel-dependent hydrogenase large subunit [Candidatus Jordarchaeia archaeon]
MSTVKIPIGPQHPALKEPVNFTVEVDGEQVVDAKVRIGYNHRGIEKAAELRTYVRDIYLLERVCGICSHSHTTTFTQGVEELLDEEVPRRGLYIRTIVCELERLHSHMLWLGVAGHEIGFDTLLHYTWRDRELVMDFLEMISGNRVNYAMNTIGGVRRDISKENISKIKKGMDIFRERVNYYLKLCINEPTVLKRTQGVGVLPPDIARKLGAVGPTLRASGINMDCRKDDPNAAYGEVPFEVVTWDTCDVFGRVAVRVLEMVQSCNMIQWLLDHLPKDEIRLKLKRRVPEGEVLSRYEAPRGELIHYIKANGTDKPERVKIRTPTLANWPSVEYMLKGEYIADVPITIASIDPCLSCTDRITFVDTQKEKTWTMDLESLRRYGIEFYEKNKR